MRFKKYEVRILMRVLLLFVTLLGISILVVEGWYIYLPVAIPLAIYEAAEMLRFQKNTHQEIQEFARAVRYRDFSRHFDVESAPAELQPLRSGFNMINDTFKTISRERETQHQYLQKILELVDTGIISYNEDNGEIGWMNEAFKNMYGIPYLKNIASLKTRDEALYHDIVSLKPGDSKVISLSRDKQLMKILVTISVMRSNNKVYRLLAFQNISAVLDETESKAWQKLLNVMTHEIMNSVAPISSLADTLKNRLQTYNANSSNNADLDDLELGIDTIKHRSEGLLKFTENYRNLNKITRLDLKQVLVRNLFENLNTLMQPTLLQKNIDLNIILRDTQIAVEIDTNLIEQVLINLLVNAIEAVKDTSEPAITLSAESTANHKTTIKIADNGIGMPPELLDKIFIPFFSTRKTGSGIGLSLCKQIMMLHKANIQVQSVEGEGSVFTLIF